MKSLFKIIVIILLFIGVGFIISNLADNYNIFPIKQDDVSTLINTLWQVHAGLATTSIAILALITGLNKEKKYGFKTLDFMININRGKMQLKFHEEISISIILVFIQYIFVAVNTLGGSVFLFSIAVYFIIRILNCSIKMTLFEDKVNEEIKNYIKLICSQSIKEENKHIKLQEKTANGQNTKSAIQ
ncbi:hypothetical protein R4Z10_19495 [Niallia sp. XMNu-256]|uniref:hypothetical protein n=1 Tax=Niallia sp. XMNu-256 TaxID=3082444 RepID=UPI0030D059DB